MADCGCEEDWDARDREQRSTLRVLLLINAAMFVVEIVLGLIAQSTGLIADSLDMLADASVYGIAIYAVGRSAAAKRGAARLGGATEMVLAVCVAVDVVRRVFVGSEPVSTLMMGVGGLALIANLACLAMLSKHKEGEVHMRASWIFSVNDVLANIGVIVGGLLVLLTGTRWPDLAIGAAISVLVLRGGIRILREAREDGATQASAQT